MQVCQNCGHRNRPGVVFCENCGASLIGSSPLSTKSFGQRGDAAGDKDTAKIIESAGSDVFGQGTILRMEIEGAEPILLRPKQETVFGRRDPATGSMPDVDLTPFAGYRMGVSRKHAVVRQSESSDRLDLLDLGSSNGTFLNGARLSANRPYRLRDGDEVRFGQMVMKVYFQAAGLDKSVTPSEVQATPKGKQADTAPAPGTQTLDSNFNPISATQVPPKAPPAPGGSDAPAGTPPAAPESKPDSAPKPGNSDGSQK